MDIASFAGLFLAVCMIILAVAMSGGATVVTFLDYPSLMITFGGTLAAVMISFPLKNFLSIGSVLKKVFMNRVEHIPTLIETIVRLAETARRDGLLALENKLDEIENPFIVLGIQMAVDGTRPEIIEDVMRTELDAVATRHRDGKNLFDQFGKYAPAFGMIGTLVGLVIMLRNMSDPSSIGTGMAVALITTLYGAIAANMVFLPFADKLGYLNKQELLAMELIIRGIMSIQSGDNPRIIEQKLKSFVPPKSRPGSKEAA